MCYFCCHALTVQGMKIVGFFLGVSLAKVSCRNESTSYFWAQKLTILAVCIERAFLLHLAGHDSRYQGEEYWKTLTVA